MFINEVTVQGTSYVKGGRGRWPCQPKAHIPRWVSKLSIEKREGGGRCVGSRAWGRDWPNARTPGLSFARAPPSVYTQPERVAGRGYWWLRTSLSFARQHYKSASIPLSCRVRFLLQQ